MAEVLQMQEAGQAPRKRKIGHKKGKGKKKMKVFQGSGQKVKMDGKTKKLFRKKARDYNSDDSDDDNDDDVDEKPVKFEKKQSHIENKDADEKSSDEEMNDEDEDDDDNNDVGNEDVSDDEEGITEHGILKFSEGSTSFKKAFKKIVNRSGTDDVLGPVLSAHKNLVVKKLAEEAAEKKVKGDAKKEKALLREKGHVKPDAFSVSHEKLLIGIATKGVVKLFNAVNKAQTSQKGLNPSRSKDAKVIQKRRKEAFFSELGKSQSGPDAKAGTSGNAGDEEGPAWAPLRDNYMLTTSKLKDWDKAADEPEAADDFGGQEDSSSEDDD
ncbi:putative ribosomal RNA-processing protein [Helianthus annuus]|nr:putative ribosomal RNA-processing protein [Helianthus annuus]